MGGVVVRRVAVATGVVAARGLRRHVEPAASAPGAAAASRALHAPAWVRPCRRSWRTTPTPPPPRPWPQLAAERGRFRGPVDGGEHLGAVDLGHRAAPLAGEHQLALLVAGVAGEERVAALEAMHDAGSHQGVDGPVDRDRRQPLAAPGHAGPAPRRRRWPGATAAAISWNTASRRGVSRRPLAAKALRARAIASSRHRSWSCPGAGKACIGGSQVHGERYNTRPRKHHPPGWSGFRDPRSGRKSGPPSAML